MRGRSMQGPNLQMTGMRAGDRCLFGQVGRAEAQIRIKEGVDSERRVAGGVSHGFRRGLTWFET